MWGGSLPNTRRAVLGGLTGLGVALGGNLGGCSSWLLGLDGGNVAASTRLDVLIPVKGYKRCVDYGQLFEFTYPQEWLADQTLLYRAAQRAEAERALDLPALSGRSARRRSNVVEPTVAFGPAGSTGEVNVSMIVAPIYVGFNLASMGTPEQVAERFLATIAPATSNLRAVLLAASYRQDSSGQLYYTMDYTVQGPAFYRHNISVITSRDDLLYTLNAQAPETQWADLSTKMRASADSFRLLPSRTSGGAFPTRL